MIEKISSLRMHDKFFIRAKNFLKLRAAAYTLSAVAGVSGGAAVQDLSRSITKYDPVKHELLKKISARAMP